MWPAVFRLSTFNSYFIEMIHANAGNKLYAYGPMRL